MLVPRRSERGGASRALDPTQTGTRALTPSFALEEIRRVFDRYRRIARHGMVTEREEIDAIEETARPGVLESRSAHDA